MESWWKIGVEEICQKFSTDQENGLFSQEANQRLKKYGENSLPPPKKTSSWAIFLSQFKNYIVYVLITANLIALFLQEWIDAFTIFIILILNAILGFIQEWKSIRSIEELTQVEKHTVKVLRDGELQLILCQKLVPGDVVMIEAGDRLAADGRVLKQFNLQLNEAALTGESLPVLKSVAAIKEENLGVADRRNMVFRGTSVTSGKGIYLVTETGLNTEIGKITQMIESIQEKKTPLEIKLQSIGKTLIYFCIGMILLIFLFGWWKGISIYYLIMTALSLAVAAIPEGLPAVVTISLAIGVQRMVKRKALVRKLTSVETLGCITVICSDKTGTLTKNKMRVQKVWMYPKKEDQTSLALIWKIAALCNSANLNEKNEEIGDPTETALLIGAKQAGFDKKALLEKNHLLDEMPFDSERKRMSVLIENEEGRFLYCKGAPDVLIHLSNSYLKSSEKKEMDHSVRLEIAQQIQTFSENGLRVLGFAYKPLDHLDESDLIFVGLIAMHDPPREGVKESIKACKDAGIQTLMLTGDHKKTAIAIAKELEILGEEKALDGVELDQLSDQELEKNLDEIRVLARVSARHKMRIIDAFQKKGDIVAMTGDGVNDAPAVEKADIGISMGITGTDVTKSSSDLVILDDHFSTIVHAIEEGRSIYDHIIKFTSYLFSCNLAEVIIVFCGIFFLSEILLSPIQLLWINLITDGLPAIALAMDPFSPDAMKVPPRNPKSPLFSRGWLFRLCILAIVIVFLTIGIFLYLSDEKGMARAQTTTFSALVIFELSKAFLIRVPYRLSWNSNLYLVGAIGISILLQLSIIYIPLFNSLFETTPMYLIDWALIALGLCILWIIGYPLLKTAKMKDLEI